MQVILPTGVDDQPLPGWFFERSPAEVKAHFIAKQKRRELDQVHIVPRSRRPPVKCISCMCSLMALYYRMLEADFPRNYLCTRCSQLSVLRADPDDKGIQRKAGKRAEGAGQLLICSDPDTPA